MTYTFNTKVLFLLAKLARNFEKDLETIKGLFDDGSPDLFLKLVMSVIATMPEVEEDTLLLLAEASRRPVSEIREMDGYTFLKEFRLFLETIDWKKLMGESLGLVLPASQENQATLSQ